MHNAIDTDATPTMETCEVSQNEEQHAHSEHSPSADSHPCMRKCPRKQQRQQRRQQQQQQRSRRFRDHMHTAPDDHVSSSTPQHARNHNHQGRYRAVVVIHPFLVNGSPTPACGHRKLVHVKKISLIGAPDSSGPQPTHNVDILSRVNRRAVAGAIIATLLRRRQKRRNNKDNNSSDNDNSVNNNNTSTGDNMYTSTDGNTDLSRAMDSVDLQSTGTVPASEGDDDTREESTANGKQLRRQVMQQHQKLRQELIAIKTSLENVRTRKKAVAEKITNVTSRLELKQQQQQQQQQQHPDSPASSTTNHPRLSHRLSHLHERRQKIDERLHALNQRRVAKKQELVEFRTRLQALRSANGARPNNGGQPCHFNKQRRRWNRHNNNSKDSNNDNDNEDHEDDDHNIDQSDINTSTDTDVAESDSAASPISVQEEKRLLNRQQHMRQREGRFHLNHERRQRQHQHQHRHFRGYGHLYGQGRGHRHLHNNDVMYC